MLRFHTTVHFYYSNTADVRATPSLQNIRRVRKKKGIEQNQSVNGTFFYALKTFFIHSHPTSNVSHLILMKVRSFSIIKNEIQMTRKKNITRKSEEKKREQETFVCTIKINIFFSFWFFRFNSTVYRYVMT